MKKEESEGMSVCEGSKKTKRVPKTELHKVEEETLIAGILPFRGSSSHLPERH